MNQPTPQMQNYSVTKKLGSGAFGTAYLAKSKKDGNNYVIKEVCMKGMGEKDQDAAKREVEVLKKCNHPNVVHYEESFVEGDRLYIVMEYCDRKDLDALLAAQKEKGPFSENEIFYYFVQLCLAFKHIHDRRILHRDMKGANVFLKTPTNPKMKAPQIKIGDFGVSKIMQSQTDLAKTFAGTPYFMAPEILQGKKYNNKSDIWSLGCLLYHMCTFKYTVEASTLPMLVMKVMQQSTPSVREHYSEDVQQLLDVTLRKEPDERLSITQILKLEQVKKWIPKLLTPEELDREFHGVRFTKRVPTTPQAKPVE